MEIKGFFLLLAPIANLILGIAVFLNNPKENTNRIFALFCISVVFWTLINFLISLSINYDSVIILGKLAFASGCIPPPLMLCFFIFFLKIQKIKLFHLLLICFPALPFIFLSFTDLLQKDVIISGTLFRPVYGTLHKYYALYITIYMLIPILLPFIQYQKIKDPLIKLQIKYILVGLILSGIIIFINNILFPLFKGFRPFFGLSQTSTVIFVGFVSYTIIKYRFMDFYVLLRKTILYFFLVIMYMIIITFLMIIFMPLSDLQNMVNIVYRSLLIAFIISLVFPVLKGPVEEFVNKYIFPGQSHYQRELKNISRDLGKLYDLPELKNFVIKQLINTMKIKVADLVIFNLNSLGSPSFREMLDNPLIYLMKDKKDILVSYELKRSLSFEEYEKIKRGFDILNAVVIIPLMIKEDMIGFISLGEKLSGDIYSIEDINFLSTIGNQVAVAIQNAKLYNQILQIKEYNENILEQMANGVITVDKEMNITTFNKKARELINIHSWTVIGKKIDMIQNEIAGLIHETLKSEKGFSNIETYLFTNKGLRIPINCSTSLLKDHQGKIIGALAVFTDLTEIKQLEAEVRRAERLATIGTLAAGMAHEIKNPLVSLKTFTQLLPSKYDDPEFRNGFAEIAQKEVDRINNIVEQLLRFAAPSKPIFVSHDIHQSIDETLFLLASEISKKGVKIEKNLSKENFTVFADKEQLKQVFINIFMNALDAIAKNKEPIISISTNVMESTNKEIFNLPKLSKRYSLTNREVVVKISDNGVGIPEEIINHIFDPFFTTKEKGHGLGLSIAHRIVREHGGFISVQSKVGEGATFSISLPIIEEIKEDWKEFQDEAFADRLQ